MNGMNDVKRFIMEELGLCQGDTIVVAVSGGPDSMALLHLLLEVRKEIPIQVVCAHVNHNVRLESADEKLFVENYCLDHDVIFEHMKIDHYGHDNFHYEAHERRYSYFEQLVHAYQAKYLFTAHHGDDLMETILMRIVRGSTLRGYSGFSKVFSMNDYKIVRPFIELTKENIILYNQNNGVCSVTDSSNEKDVYTRNRFRKYIVSELKKESSVVHEKFYQFSRMCLLYSDYVDRQVENIIREVYQNHVINLDQFLKQDILIQRKIIDYILCQIYHDDLDLVTSRHVDHIMGLINSKRPNGKVSLPHYILAIKSYNFLRFEVEKEESVGYEFLFSKMISLPNGKTIEEVNYFDEGDLSVCLLCKDEVAFPLMVRTRISGDMMSIKGMEGHKKINDIFIDCKVPLDERNEWPIVVDANGEIVWLPGLKKSKFCKNFGEKYDIILRYY